MAEDARQALARRLRTLREQHWPGVDITQQQLAEALGGRKPLSISLISSWENASKPVVPPDRRLEAYATFFATTRSVETEPYQVLMLSQLDDNERMAREELWQELRGLRKQAVSTELGTQPAPQAPISSGFWHYGDENVVTIVCAPLPPELQANLGSYTDPASPDYVALYTYADLDALIELYGHIRAANPMTQVHFKTVPELAPDDISAHLVLLGGVDWNTLTEKALKRIDLPVRQVARHAESDIGGFEVQRPDGSKQLFAPQLDSGQLVEDVAHFYRGPNPFNAQRTVTICNGMYGRGTYGVVRALTDARFRDSNSDFLTTHFAGSSAFSILSRVSVLMGQVLTPDWTQQETRMHEWRLEDRE